MILDKIENIALYKGLGKRISQAVSFIEENDLKSFERGRYEVDGDNIFVMVQEYNTKDISEGNMEAHRKYIDIQYMLEGEEMFGFDILNDQKLTMVYDEEREVMFFENKYAFRFKLSAGQFTIFYPWDIHMPGIKTDEVKKVKKAVFKVRVE